MPSTEKQKAKKKRSRQSNVMSDMEIVDIMLGKYSRSDEGNKDNDSDFNLDTESKRLQRNTNSVGEDFRSLLITNSRENSERTIETTRMVSEEITNQFAIRLKEVKSSLNSQILDAISTEKVLPSIQNTLDAQGRANFSVMDRRSSGLQKSPEAGIT